jgi:hypothetical protein
VLTHKRAGEDKWMKEANERLLDDLGFKNTLSIGGLDWRWNRLKRMAFSHQAMRDADEKWFAETVKSTLPEGIFAFYFVTPPKDDFCSRMLSIFGMQELYGEIRLVKLKR